MFLVDGPFAACALGSEPRVSATPAGAAPVPRTVRRVRCGERSATVSPSIGVLPANHDRRTGVALTKPVFPTSNPRLLPVSAPGDGRNSGQPRVGSGKAPV